MIKYNNFKINEFRNENGFKDYEVITEEGISIIIITDINGCIVNYGTEESNNDKAKLFVMNNINVIYDAIDKYSTMEHIVSLERAGKMKMNNTFEELSLAKLINIIKVCESCDGN